MRRSPPIRRAAVCPAADRLEDRVVPSAALVRDINLNTASAAPGNLVDVGGRVYFSARDGDGDVGLYTSDGTTAHTVRVRDFGPADGAGGTSLSNFTNVGETVFFSVTSGGFRGPAALWATDGSPTGTRLVHDLAGDGFTPPNSTPTVVALGGAVYFLVTHRGTSETTQLWRSDGTVTAQVDPGGFNVNPFFPGLTVFGDALYFAAGDPANGTKLWRTDGTDAGTQIADADLASQGAFGLTVVDGSLYFFASPDGPHRTLDLYRTDGTATTPVSTGFSNFVAPEGEAVNGRLFFSAADAASPFAAQLWVSDGTAAGTVAVHPAHASPFGLEPFYLTAFNGLLLFNGFDDAGNLEPIWVSDGTDAGTRVLFPNASAFGQLAPDRVAVMGPALYFGAQGFHGNQELWRTDGTPDGTARVADFGPGALSSAPTGLTLSNGTLFLDAADLAHGAELWTSDGTATGTQLVVDLNTDTVGSNPTELRNADGRLFFTADDGTGAPAFFNPQVWASDGTAAGTRQVAAPFPDGGPSRLDGPVNLTPVGDRVFFTPANDPQLWVTDGRPGGTRMLRDFASADGFVGPPSNLTAVGDRLYFTVDSPTDGREQLWQSDGTPDGTVLVAEHLIVAFGSGVTFRGAFYFIAVDPVTFESQVWRSDGTPAGTHVADPDHPGTSARHLTVVGDRLYYFDADATAGLTVWRTDGRRATLVSDVHPDGGFWFEYNPVAVGGRLMFAAVDGVTGAGELWTSGGNPRNTRPVAAVRPDFGNTAVVGDRLFFTATTDAGDRQLWVSRGTAASTRPVAPIISPTDVFGDPLPIDLTAFGGKVYFTATDPAHGQELWESDGTAAGTRVSADLFPGPASSAPDELTVVGDTLFFAASDRLHGRELWALRPSGRGKSRARSAKGPARLVSGLTGSLDGSTPRTMSPTRDGTVAPDRRHLWLWVPGRLPPVRISEGEPPGTGPATPAPGPDDDSTLGI